MEKGERVKAAPAVTGLDNWIEGIIIDIEDNPFRGLVISIKDEKGCIYWGESKYFKFVEYVCDCV
ncbi:hypothetical protein EZS27_027721 [termite gut metagenome]|uniref:Uncharacterized protein n=1 Tax=termite gut metagenome TaxID=433724 RepID=A0A5J4QQ54_9ZZZZ